MDAGRELQRVEKTINKIIQLQNKVKIRYVNNCQLMEYLYLKYNTDSAAKLEKQWKMYQDEKEERKQFAEAEAKIEYYQKQLVQQLAGYRVQMPERWISQTAALLDKREMVEIRQRQKRGRTAEGYTSTMNSFIQFRKNEDLSFEAFDSELMEMYEAYLKEKGLVKNSTSYYMRIWRSVYNLAVEQGYTTDKKPFKHVYTGIDKTVKRAVPFKIIKMIKELDLSFEPPLELARDIFLFSFYTRGMSFIDMAHLKKSNLQNGILTYSRKKTGQRLTILWEELMQEIVDKYKDDSSEYLLPILRYCDINDRKQYKLRAKQIGRDHPEKFFSPITSIDLAKAFPRLREIRNYTRDTSMSAPVLSYILS